MPLRILEFQWHPRSSMNHMLVLAPVRMRYMRLVTLFEMSCVSRVLFKSLGGIFSFRSRCTSMLKSPPSVLCEHRRHSQPSASYRSTAVLGCCLSRFTRLRCGESRHERQLRRHRQQRIRFEAKGISSSTRSAASSSSFHVVFKECWVGFGSRRQTVQKI